ncbi:MAG: hypothetical protein ACTIKE_15825 [Sphingobacterium sp.]
MNKGEVAKRVAKKETLKDKILPKNWDIKDSSLEEEFFKAFERGEKHGVESFKETLKKDIQHRINRAATLSETLHDKITKDYNINISKLILNYSNMPCFESLFIIPKEFYLSDQMLNLYKDANQLKADFNEYDTFRIDFKFMFDSPSINYALLRADGFVMMYEASKANKA